MEQNERIEHIIADIVDDTLDVTPRTHLEKVIHDVGNKINEKIENQVQVNVTEEPIDALTNIKVGEEVYSVGGGGGGTLYKHLVQFSAGASRIGVTIISTDDTAFDRTKLMQYLVDNGHISESASYVQQRAQSLICVGGYGTYSVLSLTLDSDGTHVTLFTTEGYELNKLVSTTNFIDVVSVI